MSNQIPVSDYPYEILTKGMVKIKENKNVKMYGDRDVAFLRVNKTDIYIPMKLIHQVERGLVSYIQRFYRKKK